jgi:hypothetical protein
MPDAFLVDVFRAMSDTMRQQPHLALAKYLPGQAEQPSQAPGCQLIPGPGPKFRGSSPGIY